MTSLLEEIDARIAVLKTHEWVIDGKDYGDAIDGQIVGLMLVRQKVVEIAKELEGGSFDCDCGGRYPYDVVAMKDVRELIGRLG